MVDPAPVIGPVPRQRSGLAAGPEKRPQRQPPDQYLENPPVHPGENTSTVRVFYSARALKSD